MLYNIKSAEWRALAAQAFLHDAHPEEDVPTAAAEHKWRAARRLHCCWSRQANHLTRLPIVIIGAWRRRSGAS